MSFWVQIYFSGYIVFSVWAHLEELRHGDLTHWTVLEIVGNLGLLLAALAFWYPQIYLFLGKAAVPFYIVGVLSVAAFAYKGIRGNQSDPELTSSEKTSLSFFSTALLVSTVAPLFWWGAQVVSNYL